MSVRPTIHKNVKLIFSTASDGSMAGGGGQPADGLHTQSVDEFLRGNDFPTERARVYVRYGDEQSYVKIERVDAGNAGREILADALYTTEPGRVITLPVADCIAAVVYDPVTKMLGVLHLGRHSSVAGLIEHFVLEVADRLGSDPRDWLVWMSPSLKMSSDKLEYFTPAGTDEWKDYVEATESGLHIDIAGHNKDRFIRAGVDLSNIIISPVDTYQDRSYFSHRAATEQADDSRQGRMIVAAYVKT